MCRGMVVCLGKFVLKEIQETDFQSLLGWPSIQVEQYDRAIIEEEFDRDISHVIKVSPENIDDLPIVLRKEPRLIRNSANTYNVSSLLYLILYWSSNQSSMVWFYQRRNDGYKKNETWKVVHISHDVHLVGSKWVYTMLNILKDIRPG